MTDNTPIDERATGTEVVESPSRLYGVIDRLTSNRIAGWAIDRGDANAAVTVEILRDGRSFRRVVADRLRPDLEKGGVGTGKYGFAAEIDPPLDEGMEFTLEAVAHSSDGLRLSLKPVGAADRAVAAELKMMHRVLTGVEELRARQSGDAPAQAMAALEDTLARVEITQARIEKALAEIESRPAVQGGGRYPLILWGTAGAAFLSLTIGIASFWY